MTHRRPNRASESIVVTGTGNVIVGKSITPGCIGFAQIPNIVTGDPFEYGILDPVTNDWELGSGIYVATPNTSFSRQATQTSKVLSGPTSNINFQGNICLVWADIPAENLLNRYVSSPPYAASGPITISDDIVVLNSVTPLAMTLDVGTNDGKPMLIKNISSATHTVTGSFDGASRSLSFLPAGSVGSAANVRWIASLATYLVEL